MKTGSKGKQLVELLNNQYMKYSHLFFIHHNYNKMTALKVVIKTPYDNGEDKSPTEILFLDRILISACRNE